MTDASPLVATDKTSVQIPLTRRTVLKGALAAASFSAAGRSVLGNLTVGAPDDQAVSIRPASPTGWTSFRNGPEQTGVATCELAQQPKLRWELESKDGWAAPCAIADDHVYAPALEGFLYCLDRVSGRVIWKYRTIESTDPKEFAPGFKAAPMVTADTVYVGDEDGFLHAVARDSGELRWKFATGAEIAGGVMVYEQSLLLASHDSFLYLLDADGKEIWSFQTNDRINCSPAVVEHFTYVAGCDEQLRIIDLKTGTEARGISLNSYLIASPAIAGDLLYVGTHTGQIIATDWKTGEIRWTYEGRRTMPYHASAAVSDDLVLVGGHDKLMHAVDRKSGEERWLFPTKARINCSAAVAGGRVLFGSGDGNLYGVSLESGKEQWRYSAGAPLNAGIAVGEGSLVIGEDDSNGRLLCFS